MIKWLALGLIVIIALVVAMIIVVGLRAPSRHVARVSLDSKRKPEQIWPLLADFSAWPRWNASIQKIERLPDRNGHAVWAFTSGGKTMASEVVEMTPPSRVVTRIVDENLPFGGSWTWEISTRGDGTRITLTEDGFINNTFYRGMSSLFLGYVGAQKSYLVALGRKLGETGEPAVESLTFSP